MPNLARELRITIVNGTLNQRFPSAVNVIAMWRGFSNSRWRIYPELGGPAPAVPPENTGAATLFYSPGVALEP